MRAHEFVAALCLLAACGSSENAADPDSGIGSDAGATADAAGQQCPREHAAADRVRKLVVARPYGDAGASQNVYEVLELSTAGAIAATGTTFEMGRATGGVIAFTPDGEVGLVAQGDGSIGVFAFEDDGSVRVVHAAYGGDFYASSVVVDPAGEWVYILNSQWRENGGGIYRARIGCDGSLGEAALVAAGRLPRALLWLGQGEAIVAAHDILDSPTEVRSDAHLVSLDREPSWHAGITVFDQGDPIIASAALTADGRYALIGDNSEFSGVPNRVGVIARSGQTLAEVQVLSDIEDPYAIATSPFDDAAIVVSGYGDAIFQLSYDPDNTASPFSLVGELSYEGVGPMLPGSAVAIDRGSLTGRVLIAENQGVRQVLFEGGGQVSDLGVANIGESYAAIVGAMGVQP